VKEFSFHNLIASLFYSL